MQQLNKLRYLFMGLLWGALFIYSFQAFANDEHHDEMQLENVLNNYQNNQKQVLKDAEKLLQDDGTTNTDLNEVEFEEVGRYHQANVPRSRYSKNYQESLKKLGKGMGLDVQEKLILAFVPLQELTDENFDQVLKKVLTKEQYDKATTEYSKYVDLAKRVVRSQDTLPALISIISNKDRLIYYAGAILVTFIFSLLTKGLFYKAGDGFFRIIFGFLFHCLLMFVIRTGITYYFFKPELTPFIKIIQEWSGWRT